MGWYLVPLKKYGQVKGRAHRKEFWTFTLINLAIYAVLLILYYMLELEWMATATLIFGLLILVPSIAVTVRRLHDTGRSGAWYLVNFIPFIGPILLLGMCLLAGQPGDNKYGPDPKAVTAYGPDPKAVTA
jgi:uncharacterized membrane protein YhaH (DUF805 family)